MRRYQAEVDESRAIVLLACGHWIQPEIVDADTRTWTCPFGCLTQPAAQPAPPSSTAGTTREPTRRALRRDCPHRTESPMHDIPRIPVLTVRRPWAALLLRLDGKPVDNRTWTTRYRGPLLGGDEAGRG